MTPRWIDGLLCSRVFQTFARIVLTVTFWLPGFMQAAQFKNAMGEFVHFHVLPPGPFVIASFITLLIGSVLVILGGKWTWLGAGALGIYTFLTILIAHHFWDMQGDERLAEMRTAIEHLSIIGGLMTVAIAENLRVRRAT